MTYFFRIGHPSTRVSFDWIQWHINCFHKHSCKPSKALEYIYINIFIYLLNEISCVLFIQISQALISICYRETPVQRSFCKRKPSFNSTKVCTLIES